MFLIDMAVGVTIVVAIVSNIITGLTTYFVTRHFGRRRTPQPHRPLTDTDVAMEQAKDKARGDRSWLMGFVAAMVTVVLLVLIFTLTNSPG